MPVSQKTSEMFYAWCILISRDFHVYYIVAGRTSHGYLVCIIIFANASALMPERAGYANHHNTLLWLSGVAQIASALLRATYYMVPGREHSTYICSFYADKF